MSYKQYRRKQIAELADWHPGFDMSGVSVSDVDKAAGSPKTGDKIARNPANHADRWLVAEDYFAANFEALSEPVSGRVSVPSPDAVYIARRVLASKVAPTHSGALCLAYAVLAASEAESGGVSVPVEPTDGLLMSMAIRYDHALGCPGYYDQPMFAAQGITHAQRLQSTLTTMRQLYEEISGRGFYSPEREDKYKALATSEKGGTT